MSLVSAEKSKPHLGQVWPLAAHFCISRPHTYSLTQAHMLTKSQLPYASLRDLEQNLAPIAVREWVADFERECMC